jgi:hypothetical protein
MLLGEPPFLVSQIFGSRGSDEGQVVADRAMLQPDRAEPKRFE